MPGEGTIEVAKQSMTGILFRKDTLFCGYTPVDAQRFIQNTDAIVSLRMVEFVTLILEYSRLAKHRKAVCKAFRDKELTMILLAQFYSDMLSIGWTALTDIDGHIEHFPPDATHQFALGVRRTLEMQSSHDPITGHAFVVLYEGYGTHLFVKLPL